MKNSTCVRAIQAALISVSMISSAAVAGPTSRTTNSNWLIRPSKKGDAIISVRLVHKPDGKPVPNAVIFANTSGYGRPTVCRRWRPRLRLCPARSPVFYKFKATLSMAGGWQLSLGAKVQGETGTVENRLVLKATP